MNFKTFEEYLRELKHAQGKRQTESINTSHLRWKLLKKMDKMLLKIGSELSISQINIYIYILVNISSYL